MDLTQIVDYYQSSDTRLKAAQLAVNYLRENEFDEIGDGSRYRNLAWWLGTLFYESPDVKREAVVRWIIEALEDNPQFGTVSYNGHDTYGEKDLAWWYGELWHRSDSSVRDRVADRIIRFLEDNPQFGTVSYNGHDTYGEKDLAWWRNQD